MLTAIMREALAACKPAALRVWIVEAVFADQVPGFSFSPWILVLNRLKTDGAMARA